MLAIAIAIDDGVVENVDEREATIYCFSISLLLFEVYYPEALKGIAMLCTNFNMRISSFHCSVNVIFWAI